MAYRIHFCWWLTTCLVQLTVDGLAHVLCMTELLDIDSFRHLANRHQPSTSSRQQQSVPCVEHRRSQAPASQRQVVVVEKCCTLHCRHRVTQVSRRVERDVADISRYLRVYLDRLNDAEQQNRVARDWRLVARLLDRLFFFMYVSTVAVSLATIFPKG